MSETNAASGETAPPAPETPSGPIGIAPEADAVDISATLAEGRWALVRDGVVVAVETRDPTGRFPAVLAVRDARAAPADLAPGWAHAEGVFAPPFVPPVAPAPRIISAEAFLALFTPAETGALWAADTRLMRGAMLVMGQDSANMDSPELAGLLSLAVAKGVLTPARAEQVARGEPPGDPAPAPAEPTSAPSPEAKPVPEPPPPAQSAP